MSGTGNYLKDVFLAGVGMFSMTRERIQEVVDNLVRAGQVDSDQAQDFARKLGDRAESERRSLENLIGQQIGILVKEMGLVTAGDIQKIEDRIDRIEEILK